jgi:hypothetical protein
MSTTLWSRITQRRYQMQVGEHLTVAEYRLDADTIFYRRSSFVPYRTFASSALACGSMVLYLYCVSFFRPAGRKNDTQGIENDPQAKVLSL